MGHRSSATAEGYRPRSVDALRPFLQLIEDYILALAGVEFDATAIGPAGLRLQVGDEARRTLCLQLVLKFADLGNAAKPLACALRWAAAITAEFYAQGDEVRYLFSRRNFSAALTPGGDAQTSGEAARAACFAHQRPHRCPFCLRAARFL
jgi:hypothetical protein